jgi:hypothetical protein
MREDPSKDARFTTLLDLYGTEGFPGLEKARSFRDPRERVRSIEAALAEDVGDRRFVPYIQLHEFEALVLADPSKLSSEFPAQTPEIQGLIELVAGYTSPEDIDDGADTAPSKRIIEKIPAYRGRKAAVGPLVTERIGLATLRERCPHFGDWVTRLESLAGERNRSG